MADNMLEKKTFAQRLNELKKENKFAYAIAMVGLIAVVIILVAAAVFAVKYAYVGITRLAVSTVSLSTQNTKKETVTPTLATTTVKSGTPFALSWNHNNKSGDGTYGLYYPCTNGINISAQTSLGNLPIECNKLFGFNSTNNQITLVATSTVKNTSIDVPISILFTKNGQIEPSVSGVVLATISGPATNSNVATTGNTPSNSSNTYSNTTNTNNNSYTYATPSTYTTGTQGGAVYSSPAYTTSSAYDPYTLNGYGNQNYGSLYGYGNTYSNQYGSNYSPYSPYSTSNYYPYNNTNYLNSSTYPYNTYPSSYNNNYNPYSTPTYYPYSQYNTYNPYNPYNTSYNSNNTNYNYNNSFYPSCRPPIITSSPYAYGSISTGFSHYLINGAEGYPVTWNVTGLPSGITLSSNILSGTPSSVGTYNVTVYANSTCGNATQNLTIIISNFGSGNCNVSPAITSPAFINANVNQYLTYQITATNFPTYFSASNLPNGLSINQSTGFISGIPTMTETRNVTLTAQGVCGTATTNLSINVGTNYYTGSPQYPTYPQYPQYPTYQTYPNYPSYPSYPNYNGGADLRVSFIESGILNGANQFVKTSYLPRNAYKIAVRFRIENIGSSQSGPFNFTAYMPTYGSQAYNSNTMSSIPAGGGIEYTLGFDQAVPGTNTFRVRADSNNQVSEINESNNEMVVYLNIQ